MRKVIITLFVLIIAIGCSRTVTNSGNLNAAFNPDTIVNPFSFESEIPNVEIVEIRERMFATHVSDVYVNPQNYLDKIIKLEGVFLRYEFDESENYNFVLRYFNDGCCSDEVGFEVKWPDDGKHPDSYSWVEAMGVLKRSGAGADSHLYLDLVSLNVLNRRGAEFVRQ